MRSFRQYLLAVTGILFLFSCTESKKIKKAKVANEFLHYFLSVSVQTEAAIALDSYTESDSRQCLFQIEDKLEGNGFNRKDLTELSLLKISSDDSVKFISKEKLPKYMVPNSWKDFNKQYKNGFYIISVPIVNDKCDSVIFYYSYSCGERCGHGEMALYKKTSSGWKLVKKYCEWVS